MLNINGEEWKLFLTSPIHPMLVRSDGQLTIGACDDKTKGIYINEELSPLMMKKVLCHELTHAAMFSYNIELSLEQEELLADLIATYGQEIINMTNSIFNRLKRNGELKLGSLFFRYSDLISNSIVFS